MSKSSKKQIKGEAPKRVAAIKNGHTVAELARSGKRWATHAGPFMTLTDVIDIEVAKQKRSTYD